MDTKTKTKLWNRLGRSHYRDLYTLSSPLRYYLLRLVEADLSASPRKSSGSMPTTSKSEPKARAK